MKISALRLFNVSSYGTMAGCLIPAILMILGAAVGAIVGGDGGSVYGAFIGLAVGMLAMVVLVFLMSMAKR